MQGLRSHETHVYREKNKSLMDWPSYDAGYMLKWPSYQRGCLGGVVVIAPATNRGDVGSIPARDDMFFFSDEMCVESGLTPYFER